MDQVRIMVPTPHRHMVTGMARDIMAADTVGITDIKDEARLVHLSGYGSDQLSTRKLSPIKNLAKFEQQSVNG